MGRQYESDLIPASIFISDNKKGLLTVMEREAAGAARNSVAFKKTTKWLSFFGNKWYFAYLF